MKKKRMTRLFAVVLSVMMIITMIQITAFAEETAPPEETVVAQNEEAAPESAPEAPAPAPAEEVKEEEVSETPAESAPETPAPEVPEAPPADPDPAPELPKAEESVAPAADGNGNTEVSNESVVTEPEEGTSEPSDPESGEVAPENKEDNKEDNKEETPDAAKEEVKDEKAPEKKDAEKDKKDADAAKEVSYPATTMAKSVNGVTVSVAAPEGSVPAGTTMTAVPVTSAAVFQAVENRMEENGCEFKDAVAFDVTLYSPDGKEVQPKIPVTVTFAGSGLDLEEGDSVSVYRVSDDASLVTEIPVGAASSDTQEFKANHFTIYVAGSGSPEDPNGDGSEEPNSEDHAYVLEYGAAVTLASDKTSAWENWNTPTTPIINRVGSTITNTNTSGEDATVTVTHTYYQWPGGWQSESFVILAKTQTFDVQFFLQDAGETSFVELEDEKQTVGVGKDATDPGLEATKTVDDKTYSLLAWYTDETCTTPAELTDIREDKKFYAKYVVNATITYDANTTDDAEVPDPQTAGIGTTVKASAEASRPGYGLDHWNTQADDGGTSYAPGADITVEGDMTLYAFWGSETVYIIYMRNNGNMFPYAMEQFPTDSTVTLLDGRDDEGIPTWGSRLFLGWATTSDGSASIQSGQSYTTGKTTEVLYAKWGNIQDGLSYTELTGKSAEETYDGTEKTVEGVTETLDASSNDPNYSVVGEYFIQGRNRELCVDLSGITASGTNAGTYPTPRFLEVFYYRNSQGRMVSTGNYIKVKPGILKINPVSVTINTDSAKGMAPVTAGGKAVVGEAESAFTEEWTLVPMVNGETLNIRSTGKQAEPGESENTYEVAWGKPSGASGKSTASKYNYKYENGVLGTLHAHGLSHVDEVPATCEDPGVKEYWICDMPDIGCGAMFADEEGTEPIDEPEPIDPLDHDYQEVEGSAVEPTCTEPGKEADQKCTHCGDVIEGEEIDPLGHDWGEWEVTKEATEDEEGEETRTCNRCGATETHPIPSPDPENISYRYTAGDGGVWTKGSGKAIQFTVKRSVDDEKTYGALDTILIDGKEADPNGIETEEGSLIIRLKADYLEKMALGGHEITAKFVDGEATASFTIVEGKKDPITPSTKPGKATKTTTTSPKTSDRSNNVLWFMILCAALLVAFNVRTIRRKASKR